MKKNSSYNLCFTAMSVRHCLRNLTMMTAVLMSAVLLSACGGGGGGSSSSSSDQAITPITTSTPTTNTPAGPPAVVPLEGQFIDSEVFGLRFESDSQAGTTDVDGTFLYLAGEQVRFYVGEYLLGEVDAKEIVTPFDLAGIEPLTGAELAQALAANGKGLAFNKMLGIAGLLQTIDSDNNPDNGISITSEVAALFTADSLLGSDGKPLPTDELSSSPVAQALLKKAINQGALTPRQLRTTQQTLAHLYASLEVGTVSKVLSQQITTTTNGDSLRIAYTYNDQGLVTVTNEDRPSVVMSPIYTTSYTYNAAGQILTSALFGGPTESYTYNTAGQPLTRATDGNVEFAATYDDNGNLLKLTVGGNTAIFTYDDNGNVLTEDSNGDKTIDITYQYDNNGRVILEDRGAISTQFSYDNNGNLRTEFDPNSVDDAVRYNYDSSGNRISSEGCNRQTANSADEIINSTDCSVRTTTTYDDNGNELIVFSPQKNQKISETRYDDKGNKIYYEDENGSFFSYQFDAAGKLVSETLAERTVGTPNPLHVITYSYDADGNLVTEVFQYLNQVGGYTTTYEYVDNNALVSIPDFSVGNGPLFDNSLEADVKRNGVVYDLGDTGPGGGIVFYTDYDGYYLEAAPTDAIPAAGSKDFGFREFAYSPLCIAGTPAWTAVDVWNFNDPPPESAGTIGNGKSNTALFIDNCPNTAGTDFAPQAADNYVSPNGTDDWFLPSIGELNALYLYTFPGGLNGSLNPQNASIQLVIDASSGSSRYLSSTEANVSTTEPFNSIFYTSAANGGSNTLTKSNGFSSVRPVREFRAGSYPPI